MTVKPCCTFFVNLTGGTKGIYSGAWYLKHVGKQSKISRVKFWYELSLKYSKIIFIYEETRNKDCAKLEQNNNIISRHNGKDINYGNNIPTIGWGIQSITAKFIEQECIVARISSKFIQILFVNSSHFHSMRPCKILCTYYCHLGSVLEYH